MKFKKMMIVLAVATVSLGATACTKAPVVEPAIDEPAVDEPAVDEPAVDEPAVDEPAVDAPATDPAAEVVPPTAAEVEAALAALAALPTTEFANAATGFTIKIPELMAAQDGGTEAGISIRASNKIDFIGSLHVATESGVTKEDLDKVLELRKTKVETERGRTNIVYADEATVQIGGVDFTDATVTYDTEDKSTIQKFLYRFDEANGLMYTLITTAASDDLLAQAFYEFTLASVTIAK